MRFDCSNQILSHRPIGIRVIGRQQSYLFLTGSSPTSGTSSPLRLSLGVGPEGPRQ